MAVSVGVLTAFAGPIWLWSSLVAAPIYVALFAPRHKIGDNASMLFLLGGALGWFLIVYFLLWLAHLLFKHSKRGKAFGL